MGQVLSQLCTALFWTGCVVLSPLVSDKSFEVMTPFEGMLLPFMLSLASYKVSLFIAFYRHKRAFSCSLCFLVASIIGGIVVWLLVMGRDHRMPSRAVQTVYITWATGCVDLWVSYHPDTRPRQTFRACCRWLFVFGLQRPLVAVILYVQDLIGQADIFFSEELELADTEAGDAA